MAMQRPSFCQISLIGLLLARMAAAEVDFDTTQVRHLLVNRSSVTQPTILWQATTGAKQEPTVSVRPRGKELQVVLGLAGQPHAVFQEEDLGSSGEYIETIDLIRMHRPGSILAIKTRVNEGGAILGHQLKLRLVLFDESRSKELREVVLAVGDRYGTYENNSYEFLSHGNDYFLSLQSTYRHQVWRFDLATRSLVAVAPNERESRFRNNSSPSFDCRRAATTIEKAICSTPSLAVLDSLLATLYGSQSELGIAAQKAWLEERDSCRLERSDYVYPCLAAAYKKRIEQLMSARGQQVPS